MKIQCFEDVQAWIEARKLVFEVYELFRDCRDYGLRDQIQRAAISVMSNIAEGFDRGSNKEFVHFLTIARGSVSEVKSLSYAALDLGYLKQGQFEKISLQCRNTKNLINGFIRYLLESGRKY